MKGANLSLMLSWSTVRAYTNVDQLHALLGNTERHAKMKFVGLHERNSDPLALVASHQITTVHLINSANTLTKTLNFNHQLFNIPILLSMVNLISPSILNHQSSTPLSTLGLIVPVFQKGDDPIDAINHMMSFLTAVVTSRYPTTNNQLRNSSNPRQQATINNGRVTLQPIQGRQTSFAAGTSRTYTPGASGSNSGKQRTVICYNCKGEGHMSRQCCNISHFRVMF
ncbi:retrovirus-related pol polyprotein from transposon TNT 1-94 [Tanacetum coccineum]|uniref:Retrovirus-related pol polyprotein from transposon TNT 1-94 n=1 Tax=Tanacetum coccineum TaxID=301880 RepID=A0ABQ5HTG8_9ASTR